MLRSLALTLVLGAAVFACGCGGRVTTVEGTVTLDGKPVEGATVSFIPVGEKGQSANGFTDATGKYSLTTGTGKKKGALAGEYKVTVTKSEAMTTGPLKPGSPEYMAKMKEMSSPGAKKSAPKGSLLPEKYSDASKTPLTLKVPSDNYDLKLEKK